MRLANSYTAPIRSRHFVVAPNDRSMLHRVVFDAKYTAALLRLALDEELITTWGDPDHPVLQRAIAPPGDETQQLAQDALWQIVLHDEAYFNAAPVDNVSFDNPTFQQCLAPLPSTSPHVHSRMGNLVSQDAAHIHQILQASGVRSYSESDIVRFIQDCNSGVYSRAVQDELEIGSSKTYAEYVAHRRRLHSLYQELELPTRRGPPMPRQQSAFAPKLSEEAFDSALRHLPILPVQHELGQQLFDSLYPIVGANMIEANVKVALGGVPTRGGMTGRIETQAGTDTALSIWISEIKRVPYIRGFREALDLREDSRVSDFRNHLFQWAAQIRADPSRDQALRSEIAKANKALGDLQRVRRVNGWIASFLFTNDVARFLLDKSLALWPISAISFMIDKVAAHEQRRYNWLLFGRG